MSSFESLSFEIITEISTYLKGKDLIAYASVCKLTSLVKINLVLRIPSNVKKSDIVKYFSALGKSRHFDTLRLINASKVIVTALASSGIELRNLDIRHKYKLSDISFLSTLTTLTTLNLKSCGITDISVLASLTSLTELNIRGCSHITNISALGSLTSLTKLNMSRLYESSSDISFLTSLVNLVYLNLRLISNLSNIAPLLSLTSLRTLKIDKMDRLRKVKFGMSDLSSMTNLINLKFGIYYWYDDDNIDEMRPLLNIPNLDITYSKTFMRDSIPEGLGEMFPNMKITTYFNT